MSDIADDPEFKAWAEHVRAHVLPALQESALSLNLVPKGETDIKFAVELGLAIMLDKPIIAVIQPGTKVPERLVRVADHILDLDFDSPDASKRLQQAISMVMEEQS